MRHRDGRVLTYVLLEQYPADRSWGDPNQLAANPDYPARSSYFPIRATVQHSDM